MKLLRVDMSKRQIRWQAVPETYQRLGGRALIAKLLLEEVPPACDALGPDNKLIITPGLLGGAGVVAAGRLSVGGKSPLTGGVKEANAGGTAGDALGKMGIKAVVVEGQNEPGGFLILNIHGENAELLPAEDIKGLGTYATSDMLQERFGSDCTIISIGQAGEQKLRGSGICVTGEKDQRSNHAARGGLGAVMGSKGLKAVVIKRPESRADSFADKNLIRTAARTFIMKLVEDPKLGTKGSQHLYGTASIVAAVNEIGSLPTRNFSSGNFEKSENLRGEHLRETTLARGGKAGTRCMPGCVIACRNLYMDKNGQPIVGTLQYETIALVGSNLGLDDLDDVAR
ncbi:MAG: aldehyde ferredoxin oxidoreductase, partial [Anaerolineaceae bacterium]|nr:aldehyde ferredoxin oxidoreductase [Anaerolineaceae bacterium]